MKSSGDRGGGCHGCIFSLVYFVRIVLAAGFAGPGSLSDCVAAHAAVPARGDCRAWGIRVAERVVLPSRARVAGSACHLTEEIA